MKKIFIILTLSLFLTSLFGQDEATVQEKSKPVRFTFETSILKIPEQIELICEWLLDAQKTYKQAKHA